VEGTSDSFFFISFLFLYSERVENDPDVPNVSS